MIMLKLEEKYLLMIEPDKQGLPTTVPLEDELTAKLDAIYGVTQKSEYGYKGFHFTKCGKQSDNRDYLLPNGMITNSLAQYYIRYYRPFIPQTEIEKIEQIYASFCEKGILKN